VAKRQLDVDRICILVFDEADEMLKADAFADDSGEDAAAAGPRPLG
jgi:ATP-dependent RNA helicase DDX19/DBP5